MDADRRDSGAGLRRGQVLAFVVVVALLALAFSLRYAPLWVAAVVAAIFAAGLCWAYVRDRRRGQRWF